MFLRCVFLLSLLALNSPNVAADNYLIRWPAILLPEADNLRIYELAITLKCGDFKAVNNLSDDWNLEIIRPISGISELRAEAGHGASNISSLADFNDVIKISRLPENSNCFELSATVSRFDPDIAIEVTNEEITLIPVP